MLAPRLLLSLMYFGILWMVVVVAVVAPNGVLKKILAHTDNWFFILCCIL